MKNLLMSLFATLTLAVAVAEGDEVLRTFVPQAAETTARTSLRAIVDDARNRAVLAGASDLRPYMREAFDASIGTDGLTLNPDFSLEWSDGANCWRATVSDVWEAEQIVSCQ